MEKVIHFHMILPVSEFKIVVDGAPSLFPALYSVFLFLTNTIKWKPLQSKGKTWGGNVCCPRQPGTVTAGPHISHVVIDAAAAKSTSRVAINTLGPSGVRDPEGSQRGHGLIVSKRWGHAKFWSNYAPVTLPTVITSSLCRGQAGTRKATTVSRCQVRGGFSAELCSAVLRAQTRGCSKWGSPKRISLQMEGRQMLFKK